MFNPCENLGYGEEQHKRMKVPFGDRNYFYDYRHTDGELFRCVKKTLTECRAARDEWLEKKGD